MNTATTVIIPLVNLSTSIATDSSHSPPNSGFFVFTVVSVTSDSSAISFALSIASSVSPLRPLAAPIATFTTCECLLKGMTMSRVVVASNPSDFVVHVFSIYLLKFQSMGVRPLVISEN
ncbi:hypothetical protein L2E82_35828 [Cichorium intybus]|uniref:Uncharacterized protein n=1 Tax=Cichorium intybus TaxID=13427 RepID=A0ACB9BPV3_CICIN|nr:hypothetical protein L2E82_35828 [Cichorium intybus]